MSRKPPQPPPIMWSRRIPSVQMKPSAPASRPPQATTGCIQMMMPRTHYDRTAKTNHLFVGRQPQYIDRHNNRYWTGWRNDVRFTTATLLHFAASRRLGCRIGKRFICTGNADALDHITDFATTQSFLMSQDYCDGRNHWNGIPWADAMADYNNIANLRWACTPCNSSDGGARGQYSTATWAGACPAADGTGPCNL